MLRRLLPLLLLLVTPCLAQDLSKRQIAELKAALGRDDRDALLRLSESYGPPARAWIRKYNPKVADWLDRYTVCRELASRLDRAGMPAWQDKRFVRLTWKRAAHVGRPVGESQRYQHGWLIEESPTHVHLLGRALFVSPHKRLAEPAVKDTDFKQYCLDYLAHPPNLHRNNEHFLLGGMDRPGDAFLLAYFALRKGHDKIAVRLLASSGATPDVTASRVTGQLAKALRGRVALAAHEGAPRQELIELCRSILAVRPDDGFARAAVGQYASLIKEDKAWVAPTPPELATMPPDRAARYWIFRLRDYRGSGSGRRTHRLDRTFPSRDADDPRRMLVALGWGAIPALIESSSDRRPSRSLLRRRPQARVAPIGMLCRDVLTLLTGEHNPWGGWWANADAMGPEKYYRSLIRGRIKQRPYGVRGLARLGFDKHRKELLAAVRGNANLVHALALELDAKHDAVMDAWLRDDRFDVMNAAARALWERRRSDRGAKAIIARARAMKADAGLPFPAVVFLGRIHTEECARALVEFMDHPNTFLRHQAIFGAAYFPHPDIARALMERLESDGEAGGVPVRNSAAIALARMVDYPNPPNLHVPDTLPRSLKEWCEERWDHLDWEALRAAR